ncbi:uncharacterized protein NECHADRAFT_85671 [Fusarium vanettenii 77-13-4]|uniref:Uncharacterized protein n=1 Tax=Fusarium vanettenii (strain ATCC MYA-4622 / CBS 123669 / FGSC 9596 / NRRL 45880 / 77-13-4) TaxID=660122 RepID=C7ZPC5_FUSV7|nr:uncharacterized protein NECHADRAFT_85671 [Fusarium vanettenii 77-13-4]EEU34117.1 predicted protein [Fusarium vanettenii 77-13-4]
MDRLSEVNSPAGISHNNQGSIWSPLYSASYGILLDPVSDGWVVWVLWSTGTSDENTVNWETTREPSPDPDFPCSRRGGRTVRWPSPLQDTESAKHNLSPVVKLWRKVGECRRERPPFRPWADRTSPKMSNFNQGTSWISSGRGGRGSTRSTKIGREKDKSKQFSQVTTRERLGNKSLDVGGPKYHNLGGGSTSRSSTRPLFS